MYLDIQTLIAVIALITLIVLLIDKIANKKDWPPLRLNRRAAISVMIITG